MSQTFMKLTRPEIRKLKPGDSITEHGITADCLSSGDIRYTVNIMVDGQRIHRVIGREADGTTRTQAEQFIAKARTEAKEGRLKLPKGRKIALTFSEAADNYLARLEATDGKNMKAKKRHMTLFLKPEFGKLPLANLTDFGVKNYTRKRKDSGAEPGTINRELATLSHLFSMAEKWKWLDSKPCHIEKLPENPGRITVLSEAQCDALMQAAINDEDPDCWLFVAFGLNTSMRHSEMLRARYDMIDFDAGRLYVGQAKAGPRSQPMTRELVEILRREREAAVDPDGWIFPSPRPNASTTGHRHRMDRPFDRAVAAAGLDAVLVTPHVMRHTAITRLVMSGVDLPTIKAISGHKTIAMVMRYTHVFGTHVDDAVSKLGRGIPTGAMPKKAKAAVGRSA